jgi:hypothetical protein
MRRASPSGVEAFAPLSPVAEAHVDKHVAAVQAVTMPGRSVRRCRCYLYCTNTIGPHDTRDTHNDLAISRSGRCDSCLGETVASSQKEDCIGGDVSVSTLIACRVYECAIGEEYPQVKQSESITQSGHPSQHHPVVVR